MIEKETIIIQITEWKKRSERGEVCGILGCTGKPLVACPHCNNWYCNDHKFVLRLPTHLIILNDIAGK